MPAETLIADARRFLTALDANNTRDWWAENKATYDTALKAPALALLEELTPRVARLSGHPVTTKLFRPHRDVRFSKDKTPYNTHLHMFWAIEAEARQSPVYFFGIGLDYVTAGAGIMGLDKGVLEDWRKIVDLDTDRVLTLMRTLEAHGFQLREPALKRVPPPYDKNHPAAHLLRMKAVTASRELPQKETLENELLTAFTALTPLTSLLIETAC